MTRRSFRTVQRFSRSVLFLVTVAVCVPAAVAIELVLWLDRLWALAKDATAFLFGLGEPAELADEFGFESADSRDARKRRDIRFRCDSLCVHQSTVTPLRPRHDSHRREN